MSYGNQMARFLFLLGAPAMLALGCPFKAEPFHGGGGSGGSRDGTPCTSNAECDDGNPCTINTCNGMVCVHTNDDTVVPGTNDDCNTFACKNGQVVHTALAGKA